MAEEELLKDLRLEFVVMGDHIATYADMPHSDEDMAHLALFWNMTIVKNDSNNWVINGIEIRRL